MDNLIWIFLAVAIVIVALCRNWLKVLDLDDKVNTLQHQVWADENTIDYLQRKVEELSNEMEKR